MPVLLFFFLQSDANNSISKSTWSGLFKSAYVAALTQENIKHGFQACGVFPFNPEIIPSSAFAPSIAFIDQAAVETESSIATTTSETVNVAEAQSNGSVTTAAEDNCPSSESAKTANKEETLDEPSVEVSFAQDLTSTDVTNAVNLEAAQILLNLGCSGSDLFAIK